MRFAVAERLVAQQQHARHERSALCCRRRPHSPHPVTIHDFAGAEQLFHFRFHIATWPLWASGPMRTPSTEGSPITVFFNLSDTAAATASVRYFGTMARRMAVHFCPALMVISRWALRTKG